MKVFFIILVLAMIQVIFEEILDWKENKKLEREYELEKRNYYGK